MICTLYMQLLMLCIFFSCTGKNNRPLEPTLSSIQAKIFSKHCIGSGCHSGAMAESQLNLENGRSYQNLVNVKSVQIQDLYRVQPNNANQSYLIKKLEGEGIVGEVMPSGKNKLSGQDISVIRTWIGNGALVN